MDGIRRAIAMTRGTLVRIEDGKGTQVHVWDGELWITQEGDRHDHLVKAGESFELKHDGATVINALRRGVVTVTTLASAHFAKRITLTPPGTSVPRVLYDGAEAPGGWLGRLRQRLTRAWVNAYARRSTPTTGTL